MLDVPGLQHAASLGVAVGGDHHALGMGPLDGWLVMSIVYNWHKCFVRFRLSRIYTYSTTCIMTSRL